MKYVLIWTLVVGIISFLPPPYFAPVFDALFHAMDHVGQFAYAMLH
jgi:hypothetical protein